MAFTNAQLAQQIANLIEYWAEFNQEYSDWVGGTVGGGPNSDGEYPLTNWAGEETLLPCPAALADNVTGTVAIVAASEAAAAASEAAAAASEVGAALSETNSETYKDAAAASQTAAATSESNAASSAVTANAQANLALTRANAAAASAAAALVSETNADASAVAAAASEAAAATFNPALYAALADNETVTGRYTFSQELETESVFATGVGSNPAGEAMRLAYSGGIGYLDSRDFGLAAYMPMSLRASSFTMNAALTLSGTITNTKNNGWVYSIDHGTTLSGLYHASAKAELYLRNDTGSTLVQLGAGSGDGTFLGNLEANTFVSDRGVSAQSDVIDTGQVGPFAFMDYAGGVARFGGYNYDTPGWVPVHLRGSSVTIDGNVSGITMSGDTAFDDDITMGSVVGDRITLYGTKDANLSYALGVEASTLYYRANGNHRWYLSEVADYGVSAKMALNATGLEVVGDITANGVDVVERWNQGTYGGAVVEIPSAQYNTSSSTQTGAIAIKLPVAASGSREMLRFTVDVYNYLTGRSFSVHCGGYSYQAAGGTTWVAVFAYLISGSSANHYTVRFGNTGTRPCVWIGELTDSWSYCQVRVREFYAGYTGTSIGATYADDWTVGFEATSFAEVDAQVVDVFPMSSALYTKEGMELKEATATYGSLNVTGYRSTYTGIQLDGKMTFMQNSTGTVSGLYNHTGSDWHIQFDASGGSRYYFAGSPKLETLSTGIEVTGEVWINDANTKLLEGVVNSVRVQTNSGYVDVGPQNTSWCHFTTDRSQYYFDKPLHISGQAKYYNKGAIPYYDSATYASAKITVSGTAPTSPATGDIWFDTT